MSSNPTPLAQPPQSIMNLIDANYGQSLDQTLWEISKTKPGEGLPVWTSKTALFLYEIQTDGQIALNNGGLTKSQRLARFYAAIIAGRGPGLITELAAFAASPSQWLFQQSIDEILYWPPSIIPPETSITPEPGETGGVALPGNAVIPGVTTALWPTSKPDGWIGLPTSAQWAAIALPDADVPALLKTWF